MNFYPRFFIKYYICAEKLKKIMTEYFNQINEADYAKLKLAIPEITILIAGADGEIGKAEKEWAEKITHIRSYKMSKDLIGFYQEVGKTFQEDLDQLIHELPIHVADRQKILSKRLAELNPILARLDEHVAYHLYKSFLSFANHVAKSTGGLFGFFSIGPKESEVVGLPMIHPILPIEGEEEE